MIFTLLLLLSQLSFAVPTPPPLDGWSDWLLRNESEQNCPKLDGAHQCLWMGQLYIALRDDGASFRQRVYMDTPQFVPIVGGSGMWPFEVRLLPEMLSVPVMDRDGKPHIELPAGEHIIQGELAWLSIPSAIHVPKGIAEVHAQLNETDTDSQYFTNEGRLRIGKEDMASRIQMYVARKITDGHPATVETHIHLTTTGGLQEVNIGNPFLNGAKPIRINSSLGTQLNTNQELIIQALPGEHIITLYSLFPSAPAELIGRSDYEGWPQNEHWIFNPNTTFRSVQVNGAPTVDREVTNIPQEWNERSVYEVNSNQGLSLFELHRGDPQPPPNQLNLRRKIWLDTTGNGASIEDTFYGEMFQTWRLSRNPTAELGSVLIDDTPQVITLFEDSSGVELRTANPTIIAESRVDAIDNLDTVGWNISPETLQISLFLPPGWHLIHAGGGAEIQDGFWSNKLLLKIIFILAAASIIGRLTRLKWGIIVGASLLLYADLRILTLLYCCISLIVIAYKNEHLIYVWLRRIIIFFFACYTLELSYQQSTHILHPEADSIQSLGYPDLSDGQRGLSDLDIIMPSSSYSKRSKDLPNLSNNIYQQNSPNAIAQTGKGIPDWTTNGYQLYWTDQWIPDTNLSVILMSPEQKRLLDFFRLILWIYGIWNLLGIRFPKPQSIATAVLIFSIIPDANADDTGNFNDMGNAAPAQFEHAPETNEFDDLLNAYKEELLAPPSCGDSCMTTSQMTLKLKGRTLLIQAEVHSAIENIWVLPGTTAQYQLDKIELNGQGYFHSYQDIKGRIAIRIPDGVSVVNYEARLLGSGTTAIELHQKTQNLDFHSEDWSIEGLRPDMTPEPILKLIPNQSSEVQSLQPHSGLHRHFEIGHQWRIQNTLTRNPESKGPITTQIPLLNSESILDPTIRVEESSATIVIPSSLNSISWTSQLEPSKVLKLTAGNGTEYGERWTIFCAVMHHCRIGGLVPSQHVMDGVWSPLFLPQPNEQLELKTEELLPARGQIVTVDGLFLKYNMGKTTLQTELRIKIRASLEGQFFIEIPDGEITSLQINGEDYPIMREGSKVQLPHRFGESDILLNYNQLLNGFLPTLTPPKLSIPVVNVRFELSPGPDWLIHFFAPPWGSQSLLPLHLLCWLIFALILAKLPRSPLRFREWLVLFIICIPAPIFVSLVLAGFLTASRFFVKEGLIRRLFNLSSFGLFLLMATGLLIFGILESPELLTSDNVFMWRMDRSDGTLPSIQIFHLPNAVWKVVVLLWAAFFGRVCWRESSWLHTQLLDLVKDWKAISTPKPKILDTEEK